MADESLQTETAPQTTETPAAGTSTPAAGGGSPTLADLAAKGDFKAFNAAREASLRGERQEQQPASTTTETPAKETAAETTAETGEEAAEGTPPQPDPKASAAGKELAKKKGSLQDRIDRLTHNNYATARERDEARAEVAQLRQQLAQVNQRVAQQTTPEIDPAAKPKPKVAEFETYEDFVEALADWKADQKAAARAAAVEKKVEERLENEARQRGAAAANAQQQAIFAQHAKRTDDYLKSHPDAVELFQELDTPEFEVPGVMLAHVVQSDQGPALLHHLAKNPDDFRRLKGMAPGPMLVALGKLEARLDVAPSGPTPAAKPVTNAPPPIKPVGSSATATTLSLRDLAQQGRGREFMDRRDREERERKLRRA